MPDETSDLAMSEQGKRFEKATANYRITHYPADPDRLIISFASAGMFGPGGPIKEFRGSLSKFGVSMLFVIDIHGRWYNYPETEEIFALVSSVAEQYSHVGVIGESMGACGAIAFADLGSKVSRVLAFAPQFSICHPFIAFDARYSGYEAILPRRVFWDFSSCLGKENVWILFGNIDWRELLHCSMFMAYDFNIVLVDGAPHDIARYLKTRPEGDLLYSIVGRFCDFGSPFDRTGINDCLGQLSTAEPLKPGFGFLDEKLCESSIREFIMSGGAPKPPPPAPPYPDVARGKRAFQSSTSEWSEGRDEQEDASRATHGEVTGGYSFHTSCERMPWWAVDLGGRFFIHEVRIFNFIRDLGAAARTSQFELQIVDASKRWTTVFRKENHSLVGGADGYPSIWRPSASLQAEFLRLRLLVTDFLHLDQVQVFGEPVPEGE